MSEPVTLHKYLYANANPVMYSDPSGNFSLAEFGAANSIRNIIMEQDINAAVNLLDARDRAANGENGDEYLEEQMDELIFSIITGISPRIFRFMDKLNRNRMLNTVGVCFAEGTPVHTVEGLRPIENIKKGDYVLSRDEKTGRTEWREVLRTFVTPDQPVLELRLGDDDGRAESFKVTGEHPFYVKNRGWVFAKKLLPGDEIFTSAGGWLRVSGGTWLSERQTVYNFEVDGFHTYFVGEAGVWVHNSCKMPISRSPLGKGSTVDPKKGRFLPRNLREKLAIDAAISDPEAGIVLPLDMTDPRWHKSDGWVKMSRRFTPGGEKVEVHYVFNTKTGEIDDFKIVGKPKP